MPEPSEFIVTDVETEPVTLTLSCVPPPLLEPCEKEEVTGEPVPAKPCCGTGAFPPLNDDDAEPVGVNELMLPIASVWLCVPPEPIIAVGPPAPEPK